MIDHHRVWPTITGQPLGILGDKHLSAKLLGLRISVSREFLARNSGGKTQIVLNLGTRTSLPTREFDSITNTSNPSDAP
jgi:hypothetical protein